MDPATLLAEAQQLIGTTLDELLPPEAQVHLLTAQRELLLALTVTVEHHLRRLQGERGATAATPRRPTRIDVD